MHPQWDLPLPGFEKVPAPYWYGAKAAGHGDIAPDEFGLLIASKLEEKILELGPDRVASFSAEPVQGAGGLIFPPPTYWHEVQRICAPLRRAPASRRSHHRVRARRRMVRGADLPHRARHPDDGQGIVLRLPADLGDLAGRAHGRHDPQCQ
ncbi:MAG: hypothetical protein WDM81_12165 [Rhizomicrobium sp.]